MSYGSKVIATTDGQTNRQTDRTKTIFSLIIRFRGIITHHKIVQNVLNFPSIINILSIFNYSDDLLIPTRLFPVSISRLTSFPDY